MSDLTIHPVGPKTRSSEKLLMKALTAMALTGLVGVVADEHFGTQSEAEGVITKVTVLKGRDRVTAQIGSGPYQGQTVSIRFGLIRNTSDLTPGTPVMVTFKEGKVSGWLHGEDMQVVRKPKGMTR